MLIKTGEHKPELSLQVTQTYGEKQTVRHFPDEGLKVSDMFKTRAMSTGGG